MTLTGINLPGQQVQGEKTREKNTRKDKTTEEDSKTETKECIYFQSKSQKNTDKARLWENQKNSILQSSSKDNLQ